MSVQDICMRASGPVPRWRGPDRKRSLVQKRPLSPPEDDPRPLSRMCRNLTLLSRSDWADGRVTPPAWSRPTTGLCHRAAALGIAGSRQGERARSSWKSRRAAAVGRPHRRKGSDPNFAQQQGLPARDRLGDHLLLAPPGSSCASCTGAQRRPNHGIGQRVHAQNRQARPDRAFGVMTGSSWRGSRKGRSFQRPELSRGLWTKTSSSTSRKLRLRRRDTQPPD